MAYMQWAGRVGRDELDLYFLVVAVIIAAVLVARFKHFFNHNLFGLRV